MRRVRMGLEVLFWATLVADLSSIAASAYSHWMWEVIRSGGPLDGLHHSASVFDASHALGVATWLASLVALVLIMRAPEAEKLRIRNLGAFALVTLSSTFALRMIQSGDFKAGDASHTMRLMATFVGFGMAQSVLLLLLLRRVAAAQGKPLPAWVTVGVLAHVVWLLLGALPYLQTPALGWTRLAIYAVLDVPLLVAIRYAAHARGLPRATAEVPEGLAISALTGRDWRRATDGLAIYRGAIVGKLVVVGGGLALLAATSTTLRPGAGVPWMLLDLLLTFGLVAGLWGYAAVPDETDARDSAWMASGSALMLLCLQLYQAWLVVQILDDRPGHPHAQLAAQEQLGLVLGVSVLIGLAGLLLLLASLRKLATWLALPGVTSLAGWTSLGVVVSLLGGAGLLLSMPAHRPSPTWPLALLIVPLATLVAYLRVLGALLRELRARLAVTATSATP